MGAPIRPELHLGDRRRLHSAAGRVESREARRRRWRRRRAQAGPRGATPPRSPRDPGPRPGFPLLATPCDRSSCHSGT